jgi:hypothetical protein
LSVRLQGQAIYQRSKDMASCDVLSPTLRNDYGGLVLCQLGPDNAGGTSNVIRTIRSVECFSGLARCFAAVSPNGSRGEKAVNHTAYMVIVGGPRQQGQAMAEENEIALMFAGQYVDQARHY